MNITVIFRCERTYLYLQSSPLIIVCQGPRSIQMLWRKHTFNRSSGDIHFLQYLYWCCWAINHLGWDNHNILWGNTHSIRILIPMKTQIRVYVYVFYCIRLNQKLYVFILSHFENFFNCSSVKVRKPKVKPLECGLVRSVECLPGPARWLVGAPRPCWARGERRWRGGDCRGGRSSCPPGSGSLPRCGGWSWRWRASPAPWSHWCRAPACRCAPTPRTWGWRWWRWWRTPTGGSWTPSRRCRAPRIFWPGTMTWWYPVQIRRLTLGTTTTSSTFLLILGTVLTWHSYWPASWAVTYFIWNN